MAVKHTPFDQVVQELDSAITDAVEEGDVTDTISGSRLLAMAAEALGVLKILQFMDEEENYDRPAD